ncbi:hypothetical protein FZZ91_01325 [Synechococcus sp. HB1133]|uniref:hypothetical protein n=1 Tax=unclassified Synechococcus TaxID=2626047 RepID=UPI00140E0162|nr:MULTISPECIES: hypothetical protein [unclassified Synechococcus]MCB4421478.1 hypothetical protein [Synechococcus sp. HB1133]MCB4431170.1 hypothetical protein [Synechococcus sp. HBA1120]NHI80421.1 hypothetical protein [Synechococcus sp. HB1133]
MYHPGSHVFLATDSASIVRLQAFNISNIIVYTYPLMNEYSGLGRSRLESENLFLKLLSVKMDILRISLSKFSDSLYLDSDVFLLNPVCVDPTSELMLSYSYISQKLQNDVGIFNAGYLWTSSIQFVEEWKDQLMNSKYYDQHILQELCINYKHSFFDAAHNIMPWRLLTPIKSKEDFLGSLSVENTFVLINGKKMISIHTHLNRPDFSEFNKIILKMLFNACHTNGLTIVDHINFRNR